MTTPRGPAPVGGKASFASPPRTPTPSAFLSAPEGTGEVQRWHRCLPVEAPGTALGRRNRDAAPGHSSALFSGNLFRSRQRFFGRLVVHHPAEGAGR